MPAGRRPGKPDTKAEILEAARTEFAASGYNGASIRGIARRAEVDPSLVLHYFESKELLFTESLALPINPASMIRPVLADLSPGIGERLVRMMLTAWDSEEAQEPLKAVIRSIFAADAMESTVVEFARATILAAFADALDGPEAELRGNLVAAHIVGIIVARYLVGVEPLASASIDDVATQVGPVLEAYLLPS